MKYAQLDNHAKLHFWGTKAEVRRHVLPLPLVQPPTHTAARRSLLAPRSPGRGRRLEQSGAPCLRRAPHAPQVFTGDEGKEVQLLRNSFEIKTCRCRHSSLPFVRTQRLPARDPGSTLAAFRRHQIVGDRRA